MCACVCACHGPRRVCTSTKKRIYTGRRECGESRSGEKANVSPRYYLLQSVCQAGAESRAGRARRYRMKCLLHSQPLFMPMPRFDHLANSVVARQARQTEAFRATPDPAPLPSLYFSLFVYLRLRPPPSTSSSSSSCSLLGPLFPFSLSTLSLSLFSSFSSLVPCPPFFPILLFLPCYLYFVVLLLSLLLAIMYLAPSTRRAIFFLFKFKKKKKGGGRERRGKKEIYIRQHEVDSWKPRGNGRIFLRRNLASARKQGNFSKAV